MFYTLTFEYGLWRLRINNFRARFFLTRYGAERLISRYRKVIKSRKLGRTPFTAILGDLRIHYDANGNIDSVLSGDSEGATTIR